MLKLLRSVSLSALLTLASGCAFAQSQADPRPFSVHWAVITCPHELRWRTTVDWAQVIDFEGAPVRKDVVILYEHDFLLDVRSQGLSITTDPAWLAAYDNRIDALLSAQIPDANFTGMVCIDIEFFSLTWGDRTGGPGISPQIPGNQRRYFDEWYDYIRTRRPELIQNRTVEQKEEALRSSYELASKDLLLRTIQRMQALRPQAKFGFYGLPLRRHSEYASPTAQAAARAYNDSMQWIFDAQDVFFPELYQRFLVAQTPQQVNWTLRWPREKLETLMQSNIEEARRLAGTKPVYVLTMVRFSELTPSLNYEPLTDELYDLAIRSPKQYGADGIVIWDYLRSDAERQRLQTFMTQHVNWRVREVTAEPGQPGQSDAPLANADDSSAGQSTPADVPPSAPAPTVPPSTTPGPGSSPRSQSPDAPAMPPNQPPALPQAPVIAPIITPTTAQSGAVQPAQGATAQSSVRRSSVVPQRGVRVSRPTALSRVVTPARSVAQQSTQPARSTRASQVSQPGRVQASQPVVRRSMTTASRAPSPSRVTPAGTGLSRVISQPIRVQATANE